MEIRRERSLVMIGSIRHAVAFEAMEGYPSA